jgi:hypothetical protein
MAVRLRGCRLRLVDTMLKAVTKDASELAQRLTTRERDGAWSGVKWQSSAWKEAAIKTLVRWADGRWRITEMVGMLACQSAQRVAPI